MHWHRKLIIRFTICARTFSPSLTLQINMNIFFLLDLAGLDFMATSSFAQFQTTRFLCAFILDDALCGCCCCCVAVNHKLTALSMHDNCMYTTLAETRHEHEAEKKMNRCLHARIHAGSRVSRIETEPRKHTIFSTPLMPDQRGYVCVRGYTIRVNWSCDDECFRWLNSVLFL